MLLSVPVALSEETSTSGKIIVAAPALEGQSSSIAAIRISRVVKIGRILRSAVIFVHLMIRNNADAE